mmetsp:Transcript_137498/g.293871  ORF Transcript_137498/g.293871 Transcript_137498/m.293871 type:complete len:486 (+) Transcript_137498:39-1496(+)
MGTHAPARGADYFADTMADTKGDGTAMADEEVLSPARSEMLGEFRRLLGSAGVDVPDYHLVRFLRARKWVIDEAMKQFRDTQQWRTENDVDRYRRNAPGPLGSKTASAVAQDPAFACGGVEVFPAFRLVEWRDDEGAWFYYGQTLAFGCDKKGHPIHLQRVGKASTRFGQMYAFASPNPQRRIIDGYIRMQELQAARMEEMSERLGRRVSKQVVIMDLAGLSLWPDPRAMAVFKEFISITQRYYPETLAIQFFVNVPSFFMAIWRIIHNWLDPATAQKMVLLGTNFQGALLEHIDADQLPREYGGTNDFDGFTRLHNRVDSERFAEGFIAAARDLRPITITINKQQPTTVSSKRMTQGETLVPAGFTNDSGVGEAKNDGEALYETVHQDETYFSASEGENEESPVLLGRSRSCSWESAGTWPVPEQGTRCNAVDKSSAVDQGDYLEDGPLTLGNDERDLKELNIVREKRPVRQRRCCCWRRCQRH